MRLFLAAFCLVTIQATAQFWEVTSGPPAATNCMASNSLGHVFVGTSYSAIYRTTNYGGTWVRLDNGIDDGGADFHSVETIKVAHNGTIFAGVKGFGLVRSTNNGDTWQKLDLGIEVSPSARISVSTEMLPDNNVAVFVGYDAGRPDLFMYYSSNGGDSFNEVPKSNLPGAMSSIFETFMSPNSNLMFVLVSYNKGLYRSSNMGQSWTRIDSDPNSGESDDNFLTMTANAQGVLYIGRNALPSSTKSPNAVVMRSTNDGTSWEYLIQGWDNRDITNNRIRGIVFGPGNDVWAITEKTSGVFYSTNGGDSWVSQNDGLPGGGSGYGIAVTPGNDVFTAPAGEFVFRHLGPASVNELPLQLKVSSAAYPSPAREMVTIPLEVAAGIRASVSLVDATGREVLPARQFWLDGGQQSVFLNTSTLPRGLYVWQISTERGMQTGKIVVE